MYYVAEVGAGFAGGSFTSRITSSTSLIFRISAIVRSRTRSGDQAYSWTMRHAGQAAMVFGP